VTEEALAAIDKKGRVTGGDEGALFRSDVLFLPAAGFHKISGRPRVVRKTDTSKVAFTITA